MTPMNVDEAQIAEIVQELRETGVYVDPSMDRTLPAAFQAELREQVAESKVPVYVAMVPIERTDPSFHGDHELFAGVLHGDLGEDGVFLVYSELFGKVDGVAYNVSGDEPYMAWFAATKEHGRDLQQQLTKTITYLNNGKGREVYEKLRAQEEKQEEKREEQGTSTPQPSYDEGSNDTVAAVGATVGVVLLLVGAVFAARRFGRRKQPASTRYVKGKGYVTDRPFELPAATLSMIRQSRDEQLERRAEAAVLALGEAIDRTEMKGNAPVSWQAALDHYDLSRRILDRKHSQADVVGSLVLSERGQQALSAASRGRKWTPEASCYFNPLHGRGSRQVRWGGQTGTATVPACADCARDIEKEREPDDVLDFVVDGGARHYFDLNLEPWSSTGYGALDPDLVSRLFRG